MKHLYFVFCLLFMGFCFAQNAPVKGGDINGFKLYPNPVTTGRVIIETSLNAPKRILIFDVFGNMVLETTILRKELSVSNLVSGVYVLRVFEKDKVATRKLVIK